MPLSAPTTNPPSAIPSTSRCGRSSMITRSLNVPGSLSSALHTTYFGTVSSRRTSFHLSPVGKPAPPIPRRPALSSTSTMRSRAESADSSASASLSTRYRDPVPYGSHRHALGAGRSTDRLPFKASRPKSPISPILDARPLTRAAGANSQHPRQDVSSTRTSSRPANSTSSASATPSPPARWQAISRQTEMVTAGTGQVRKWG